MTTDRRRWLLLGLCAAVLVPRVYLAVTDHGMIWSDEIFQSLEQGHRVAFGYGLVPWEFKVGARSWLLPGAIGGSMKLLAACGVKSGATMVAIFKSLFAVLAVAACYPMFRVAYALGGRLALLLLGVGASLLPAGLVYGSRALAEAASAPCLAWAVWLLLPWGMAGRPGLLRQVRPAWWNPGTRRLIAGGALLGLGTVLRYQNGVLLPGVALLVALRRGWRPAAWLTLGATLVLLLGGALDWLTWGRPFQSVVVYLRFNLIEGGANQWGIAKRGFYLRALLASNGPFVLLLALGLVAGLRRTWPIALLALLYLLVLSLIPHKELRFSLPVLPLFLVCGAVGLAGLVRALPFPARQRQAVGLGLSAVLLVAFGWRARNVTFRDIGQNMPPAAQGGPTSGLVWHAFDERNRLFDQAAKHADLCGLAAPDMNPYWTGGYSYLHRRVPLLWSGSARDLAAANYVLTSPGQRFADTRYATVAQAGPYRLLRRDGTCVQPLRGSTAYGRLTPAGVPGS